MTSTVIYDLRPIGSTVPRLAPRLAVGPEWVALVRRVPIPTRTLDRYARNRLDSVQFYEAADLLASGRLSFVEERAVENLGKEGKRFAVLVFDDDVRWVLAGSPAELERARGPLVGSRRGLYAVSEEAAPDPPAAPPVAGPAPWLARLGIVCGVLGLLALIGAEFDGDEGGTFATGRSVPASAPLDASAPPVPAPESPLAGGRLPEIAAALTRELERRPRVYRILAGEETATFEVYPESGSRLESWSWEDGTLTGPAAVGAPPLRGAAFTLNDVRLAAVSDLALRAKRRANVGEPDEERAAVVIRRELPESRALRIRTTISGPRGESASRARPDGSAASGP